MNYSDNTRRLPVTEIGNLPDIDDRNIKKAASVLRALNNDFRKQLLKIIQQNKRFTVTEIYIKLDTDQSVVSQHLAILRKAGIISSEREGKYVFYITNPSRIEEINGFVKNIIGNRLALNSDP